MKLGRKFRELMRKRLGHGPPTIIKTSTNGRPYILRGREADEASRRDFLKKAGSMAAVGGIGVLAGMAGLPVSATNTTNWNQGPGSMEIPADFVIFNSGTAWYRRRGDTAAIDDNSESDSPTNDPTLLIGRFLTTTAASFTSTNSSYRAPRIVVMGDYSTAATLTFTSPIIYEHYGTVSYTGTGDAIKISIPQTSASSVQGGVLTDSMGHYHFERILGPNPNTPYNTNANAFGIHVTSFVRSWVEVGVIQYFTKGIVFDLSATNNVAGDVRFRVKVFACNIGIHFFAGGLLGVLAQGVNIDMVVGQCPGTGLLIDSSGGKTSFNIFTGTIDNAGTAGVDYVNNDSSSGNLLLFDFIRVTSATFGTLDVVVSLSGGGTNGGLIDLGSHVAGGTSAVLGAASPATVTTPYAWVKHILKDGTIVYSPVWK